MEKSTLHFFESFLISEPSFTNIEDALLTTTLEPFNGTNPLCITTDAFSPNSEMEISFYDYETESFSQPTKEMLNNFLIETIIYNKQIALKALFAEIDKTAPKEIALVVKNKLQHITYLINGFSERYQENFKEVREALLQIELEICKKYGLVSPKKTSNTKYASISSPIKKIKWNGQINVLTTLFYELNNEFLNNGEKYIDVSQKELIDFLSNTFCDKNGKDFERASLQTNLNGGKPERRVIEGKRIIEQMVKKSAKKK